MSTECKFGRLDFRHFFVCVLSIAIQLLLKVTFSVCAEPPVRFIRPRKIAYEVEKFVGETIVLDCEVSRPNAEVSWKKDGEEIEETSNITITEDGSTRQLTIHSSRLEDTGQYLCDAKDDVMDFSLKINGMVLLKLLIVDWLYNCQYPNNVFYYSFADWPLVFLQKHDILTDRHYLESEAIVLKCELSRANGLVFWYKDNNRIMANNHFTFEEEGTFRSLIILNAEIEDTGEYTCNSKDDKIVFNVTVEGTFKIPVTCIQKYVFMHNTLKLHLLFYLEAPVSILRKARTPEHYSLLTGNELILECEVSRENATVQWLCNGRVLEADDRIHIERRGTMRKFVLSNLQVSDSGDYTCDAIDDKMNIMVTVKGKLTMTFLNLISRL